MSIFEYNKEVEEQKLRKAEYEAGVAEGELKKARETALSLAEMGLPVDKIAEAVKISRNANRHFYPRTEIALPSIR